MAGSKSHAGGGFMLSRVSIRTASTAGPVNSDACEQGLLGYRLEQGRTAFRARSRERLLPHLQQRLRPRRRCRRRLIARERGRYQQQNEHGYCSERFHLVFLFPHKRKSAACRKIRWENQGGFKWYSKRNVNLVVVQQLITRQPAKSTMSDVVLLFPKPPVFVSPHNLKKPGCQRGGGGKISARQS